MNNMNCVSTMPEIICGSQNFAADAVLRTASSTGAN